MRLASKIIICIFAILVSIASAYAQTQAEQLKQMVAQLQTTPNDNALRERIIKLAATMKPTPAIPEEAEKYEGRAKFAFKNAKSIDDYSDAAKEYEKAVQAAPWIPGYYSDLCTIYEKSGKYADAKRHCEFYLKTLTDPLQISETKQRIAGLEFGIEKAARDANKALAAPKAPDLTRLQGGWVESQDSGKFVSYWKAQVVGGDTIRFSVERYVTASGSTSVSPGLWGEFRLKLENGEFKGIYVEGTQKSACTGRKSPARATLSADGLEMTVTTTVLYTDTYVDSNNVAHLDRVNCRYIPQPEWRMVMRKQ